MGERHSDEKQSYGPGWWDVAESKRALERDYAVLITLRLVPTKSVDGRWGIRVVADVEAELVLSGYGGYGPAFPGNGQKNMAAACWHALFQLGNALEARKSDREREAALVQLRLEEDADVF